MAGDRYLPMGRVAIIIRAERMTGGPPQRRWKAADADRYRSALVAARPSTPPVDPDLW
jgi:hypothetical protein